VDKIRLPAVVRLSRSFWGDARMARPLKRAECDMKGQDARLAGVLAQCRALVHLDISRN
jgi:hypothetical protein